MIKVQIGSEVAVFAHKRATRPTRGKVTSFSESHIMLDAAGRNPEYDPVTGNRKELSYSGGYIREMTPELIERIEKHEMENFMKNYDFTKLSHRQLKAIKSIIK